MEAYVITICSHEQGGHANVETYAFGSKGMAVEKLDEEFHKVCDSYGVEELNDLSFYTFGDSFNIETDFFEIFGNLEEFNI